MEFGSESGIWGLKQDSESLMISLTMYGRTVETWKGEKLYSFEELHDMLVQKSYERREE